MKHDYNLESFFKEEEISYYLLGAFMTDGCVYNRKDRPNTKCVTLTSKDKDWLEIINQHITNKPVIKHGRNCFRIMYNSTQLGSWLESKGCTSNKSLTLEFPEIPEAYMKDFIRGCWDGDGSISFTKSANKGRNWQSQANFTSGSKAFCEKLIIQLAELGVKSSLYEHSRNTRKIENRILEPSNAWRVVLSGGGSIYNLLKKIYYPGCIAMPRKHSLAMSIIDWREGGGPSLTYLTK